MSAMNFSLADLERIATKLAASKLFAVKSEAEVLAMMLRGAAVGMNPILALSAFHVIEGRVEMKADLMVSLVRQSGLCKSWVYVECSDKACIIRTQRADESEPVTLSWTIADAQRAGLAGRGNWMKYPRAMLRSRCISELCRMAYPEITTGSYVEGETTDDGGMQMTAPPQVAQFDAGPSGGQVFDLPPPDAHDVAPPQLVAPQSATATITDAIARCASGQALLALAPEVLAAGASAVIAYAGAWERRFQTYDDATVRDVVRYIQQALPPTAFAHECWTWLEDRRQALAEADEERAAIQGESMDGMPS